jgi:hypothetical protein
MRARAEREEKGVKMKVSKFKGLIAVTVCLVIITVSAIVYEKSLPRGRYDEQGWKLFRLCETEPSEPYLELKDPLDNWTAQAIQDLSQSVSVEEQYWNQCQITNSTATVFKYGEKFYTFHGGIYTSSVSKTTYSPYNTCYELHDPLDPWTEAALEDPINLVFVDDIYIDQCALLKPNVTTILEQRPIYKYHGEYYTLDLFAFYDDFGFKPKRLVRPLITVSWIVLGCFWLGLGLYELKKSRSEAKPQLNSEV